MNLNFLFNGLDNLSNQPFTIDNNYLICNGEIFNYKELINEFELKDEYKTNSDCEISILFTGQYVQ